MARVLWLLVCTTLLSGGALADGAAREKLSGILQGSSSFKVRATAAVALGRMGDPLAVDALARSLRRDSHFAVRAASASALSRLDDDAAVQALLEGLADEDEFVQKEVKKALRAFHKKERAGVFSRELQQGQESSRRRAAARALATIAQDGDDDVARILVDGLADPSKSVRRTCRRALDNLERSRAVPLLVASLTHDKAEVRSAVAGLLAARPDQSACGPLTAALMRLGEEHQVRRAVVAAVGAHRAFFDAAGLEKAAQQGEDLTARLEAIAVLGALGGKGNVGLLKALLADGESRVRTQAATALVDADKTAAKLAIGSQADRETDARTKRRLEALLRTLR